jgi:hypothetical protein
VTISSPDSLFNFETVVTPGKKVENKKNLSD